MATDANEYGDTLLSLSLSLSLCSAALVALFWALLRERPTVQAPKLITSPAESATEFVGRNIDALQSEDRVVTRESTSPLFLQDRTLKHTFTVSKHTCVSSADPEGSRFVRLLGSKISEGVAILLQPDDRQTLEILLDAHESNRDQFTFGQAEGVVRMFASADSLQDAMAGRIAGGGEGKLFWAFHGKTCRVDVLYDPELQRASVKELGGGRETRSWTSERYLTDGTDTICVSTSLGSKQANISSGTQRFGEIGITLPLALGYPVRSGLSTDLGVALKDALSNRGFTGTYDVEEASHEHRVWVVTLHKGEARCQYLVDLERGAIPLRSDSYGADGKLVFRMINEDLREVSKGLWVPFTLRLIMLGVGDAGKVMVKEVRLTYFNVSERPADDSLRVPLPQGVMIADEVRRTFFRVDRDKPFGFGQLAVPITRVGAFSMGQPSDAVAQDVLAMPTPTSSRWPKIAIVFGVAAVLAGLVFIRRAFREIGSRK